MIFALFTLNITLTITLTKINYKIECNLDLVESWTNRARSRLSQKQIEPEGDGPTYVDILDMNKIEESDYKQIINHIHQIKRKSRKMYKRSNLKVYRRPT